MNALTRESLSQRILRHRPARHPVWRLAFFLLLPLVTRGQPAVQAWVRRSSNGNTPAYQARKVAVDSAGGVIIAGSIADTNTGLDMLIVKYSSAGMPLWTNRYDGLESTNDSAIALAVDRSGNIYASGFADNDGISSVCATIKYSSAGLPLWTNRYSGSGKSKSAAYVVTADANGDVYIIGVSGPDCTTLKYSSAGVPLWTNRYNGPGNSVSAALAGALDTNGDLYVTGVSIGSNSGDFVTFKYSGAGEPIWTNRYHGPNTGVDLAQALAVGANGDVSVTGFSSSNGAPVYATLKYSSGGVPLWTNRYNGQGNFAVASAVAMDGNGNVYVTGESRSSPSSSDFATLKYSSTGTPLWTNLYDGSVSGFNKARAMAVDGNGTVFVTGESQGNGTSADYATLGYSSDGTSLWTNRYNGPANGNDFAVAIALTHEGAVIVTGVSDGDYSGTTNYDLVTVAYAPPTPIAIQKLGDQVILTWSSPVFPLRASPFLIGSYTNVPWAASPYTNAASDPQRFFGLGAD